MSNFVFGAKSLTQLNTVNLALASVARVALKRSPYDFAIIWGWRNEAQQNGMFAKGTSRKQWPKSKHNVTHGGRPASHAFDFAPTGPGGVIPWSDTHLFAAIAGVILAAGAEMDVQLTWGGDWNRNASTQDQKLMDWGHIELFNR